jgi:hypothetical protein
MEAFILILLTWHRNACCIDQEFRCQKKPTISRFFLISRRPWPSKIYPNITSTWATLPAGNMGSKLPLMASPFSVTLLTPEQTLLGLVTLML